MSENNDMALVKLAKAFSCIHSEEESIKFLTDILSIKEIKEISQRLEVAKMLKSGMVYTEISIKTGASTATISRVNRALNYGEGGYEIILSRLSEDKA